jgi:hypothetical protein
MNRANWQREEPEAQRKAAAFNRWHEPDDARVSSPDLREARGEIPRGLLGKTGPDALEMGCLFYPESRHRSGYAADCDVVVCHGGKLLGTASYGGC